MKRFYWLILILVISCRANAQEDNSNHLIPSASQFFEFHNAFWTNMHHFLYVKARAQLNTQDSQRRAVIGVKKDLDRIDQLPKRDRDIWEKTLLYYRENLASASILFDRKLSKISGLLALEESNKSIQTEELDNELVQILTQAAKVYRAHWWPDHKKKNKEWVDSMSPLLKEHEVKLEKRLTSIYNNKWPAEGMRVDVCAYTNWAGAYSTWPPQRIAYASTDSTLGGTSGLETLFHEAMHFVERVVSRDLYQKTRSLDKQIPSQFTHAIIFYSSGYAVKEVIPDHVPYALARGFWNREPWKGNLILIEEHWVPYLEGKISLEESLDRMAKSFK